MIICRLHSHFISRQRMSFGCRDIPEEFQSLIFCSSKETMPLFLCQAGRRRIVPVPQKIWNSFLCIQSGKSVFRPNPHLSTHAWNMLGITLDCSQLAGGLLTGKHRFEDRENSMIQHGRFSGTGPWTDLYVVHALNKNNIPS